MSSLSISEYLDSNPLSDDQITDFLVFSRSDEEFVESIRRVSLLSALPKGEKKDKELEHYGLSVSNFLIRYAIKNNIPQSAVFFLKVAAENEFLGK